MKYAILLLFLIFTQEVYASNQALTPKELAVNLYNSFSQENWEKTATYYHPIELNKFKKLMTPVTLNELNMVVPQLLEEQFGQEVTEELIKSMSNSTFFSKYLRSLLHWKQVRFA